MEEKNSKLIWGFYGLIIGMLIVATYFVILVPIPSQDTPKEVPVIHTPPPKKTPHITPIAPQQQVKTINLTTPKPTNPMPTPIPSGKYQISIMYGGDSMFVGLSYNISKESRLSCPGYSNKSDPFFAQKGMIYEFDYFTCGIGSPANLTYYLPNGKTKKINFNIQERTMEYKLNISGD